MRWRRCSWPGRGGAESKSGDRAQPWRRLGSTVSPFLEAWLDPGTHRVCFKAPGTGSRSAAGSEAWATKQPEGPRGSQRGRKGEEREVGSQGRLPVRVQVRRTPGTSGVTECCSRTCRRTRWGRTWEFHFQSKYELERTVGLVFLSADELGAPVSLVQTPETGNAS